MERFETYHIKVYGPKGIVLRDVYISANGWDAADETEAELVESCEKAGKDVRFSSVERIR